MIKKILIFGINGFLGRHFLNFLKEYSLTNDFEFIGVDQNIEVATDIELHKINCQDYSALENLILKIQPDFIINFIGYFNNNNFNQLYEINVLISKSIFDILIENKITAGKIICMGSAAEYGMSNDLPITERHILKPVNNYGLTKKIQTDFCDFYRQSYNLNIILTRPFNIIGAGQPTSLAIGSYIKQIKNAKPGDVISVGNLTSKRDFLDIEDIINALWKLLTTDLTNHTFNICYGKSYMQRELLDFLIQHSKKEIKIEQKSDLLKIRDIPDSYGDNTILKKNINWEPKINIYDALIRAYDNSI